MLRQFAKAKAEEREREKEAAREGWPSVQPMLKITLSVRPHKSRSMSSRTK